jgi:uncharacterized membrane protein YdjX (TVP38/TMEM64 family)
VSRILYWLKRLGPAAVLIAIVIAALALGLQRYVTLQELARRRDWLEHAVSLHPFGALLAFLAVYTLYVACCLPGLVVLALLGGFLFRTWIGGAAILAGDTVGASLVFLAARSAFGDVLKRRAGPLAAKLEQGIEAHGLAYLLSVRLLPVAPFWLVNIASGLVELRLRTFALATCVGIAPASFVYAALGARARQALDAGRMVNAHFLSQPQTWAPLGVLAALSVGPLAFVWWRERQAKLQRIPRVEPRHRRDHLH